MENKYYLIENKCIFMENKVLIMDVFEGFVAGPASDWMTWQ